MLKLEYMKLQKLQWRYKFKRSFLMKDKYLALDIGGSAIKYALMTNEGAFVEKNKVKTFRLYRKLC